MTMKKIEDILNETLAPEMKASLQEAFDNKLEEARREIEESAAADVAARYEHDKNQMVEAMEQMLTDVIRVHEEAKAAEIAKLKESRAKYQQALVENKNLVRARLKEMAANSGKIISEHLSSEIKALHEQKLAIANEAKTLSEGVEEVKTNLVENHKLHLSKINEFVTTQLKKELSEFEQDKRALVETRVKLVKENKAKLAEAQAKFVKEAAKRAEEAINERLSAEITQLHEDIERNRENDFGRRIFEAVAAEYMTSHLAEGSQTRKLQAVLEAREAALAEKAEEINAVQQKLDEAAKQIAAAERKVQLTEDRLSRNKIMSELLSNLRGEKRVMMESMLDTVKTSQLRASFDKLLPAVLSESKRKADAPTGKEVLKENRVVTGDRQTRETTPQVTEHDQVVAEIVHLAGIRKN